MSIKVKLSLVGVVALAGILAFFFCALPVSANGPITPGQSFLTMWTWDPLVTGAAPLPRTHVWPTDSHFTIDKICYRD